jgi:hypothetical protein
MDPRPTSPLPALSPAERRRTSPAAFTLLCLTAAAVLGGAVLLEPALERQLSATRDAWRLWGQGVPLDLLQALPRGARESVFSRLQRELRELPAGTRQGEAAALWRIVAPCARGPCPGAKRRLKQARVSARLRHAQRHSGAALVLLGAALALLVLGALAWGQGRGVARMALALALLMGCSALALRVRQLALDRHQSQQAIDLGRQVVRVRLALALPGDPLAVELARVRRLVSRLDSVPAPQRRRLVQALDRCGLALSPPARGKRRTEPQARAVHCPRVLVPLARVRAATLTRQPASRTQARVVSWLSLTAGLLLLLAPLFEGLRRR